MNRAFHFPPPKPDIYSHYAVVADQTDFGRAPFNLNFARSSVGVGGRVAEWQIITILQPAREHNLI